MDIDTGVEQEILPSEDELAALMQTVLRELRQRGWTRWAVDTLADHKRTRIRHHYAGGECSLTLSHPDKTDERIQWDTRHELPTARTILDRVEAYQQG